MSVVPCGAAVTEHTRVGAEHCRTQCRPTQKADGETKAKAKEANVALPAALFPFAPSPPAPLFLEALTPCPASLTQSSTQPVGLGEAWEDDQSAISAYLDKKVGVRA